jgi:hypothetical protein
MAVPAGHHTSGSPSSRYTATCSGSVEKTHGVSRDHVSAWQEGKCPRTSATLNRLRLQSSYHTTLLRQYRVVQQKTILVGYIPGILAYQWTVTASTDINRKTCSWLGVQTALARSQPLYVSQCWFYLYGFLSCLLDYAENPLQPRPPQYVEAQDYT